MNVWMHTTFVLLFAVVALVIILLYATGDERHES